MSLAAARMRAYYMCESFYRNNKEVITIENGVRLALGILLAPVSGVSINNRLKPQISATQVACAPLSDENLKQTCNAGSTLVMNALLERGCTMFDGIAKHTSGAEFIIDDKTCLDNTKINQTYIDGCLDAFDSNLGHFQGKCTQLDINSDLAILIGFAVALLVVTFPYREAFHLTQKAFRNIKQKCSADPDGEFTEIKDEHEQEVNQSEQRAQLIIKGIFGVFAIGLSIGFSIFFHQLHQMDITGKFVSSCYPMSGDDNAACREGAIDMAGGLSCNALSVANSLQTVLDQCSTKFPSNTTLACEGGANWAFGFKLADCQMKRDYRSAMIGYIFLVSAGIASSFYQFHKFITKERTPSDASGVELAPTHYGSTQNRR